MPMTEHHDDAGHGADRAADRAGQPADRAQQLLAESAGWPSGTRPSCRGTVHEPLELGGDDLAQRFELRGDGRAGEPERPSR